MHLHLAGNTSLQSSAVGALRSNTRSSYTRHLPNCPATRSRPGVWDSNCTIGQRLMAHTTRTWIHDFLKIPPSSQHRTYQPLPHSICPRHSCPATAHRTKRCSLHKIATTRTPQRTPTTRISRQSRNAASTPSGNRLQVRARCLPERLEMTSWPATRISSSRALAERGLRTSGG